MTAPPRASDFGLPEPTPEDQAFWAPHLRDGETLLWAGRPPGNLQRDDPGEGLQIASGALLLGIVGWLVWTAGGPGALPPQAVAMVGLMALGGLHGLGLRHLLDVFQRRRTRYGLTDRRALSHGQVTVLCLPWLRHRWLKAGQDVLLLPKKAPHLVRFGGPGLVFTVAEQVPRSAYATLVSGPFLLGPFEFYRIAALRSVAKLARAVRDAA